MIERFFRSLKEECVWQHLAADVVVEASLGTGAVARAAIARLLVLEALRDA